MYARYVVGILAALTLAAPVWAADGAVTAEAVKEPVTLDQFLWTARPVVVFADSPADPRFVEQIRFLEADLPALEERGVVILTDTDPATRSPLRKELRPRGFQLVLIGRDGQVKLRKPTPWHVRELNRVIDKMPLRQQEIREALGKE